MEYEIVELKEKKIAGLSARTSNTDPDMGQIIGGLWQRFYTPAVYPAIENKMNAKAIELYSDYENDFNGAYDVTVACEVSAADRLPEGVAERIIPAGRYAKFVVKGHAQKAVADFWQKLWQMPELPRVYRCDFEEYQDNDMENGEIHIYISVK